MKASKARIIVLWFIGIVSIPMGLIPSQVMNYLTGILQPGASQGNHSVIPVITLFFISIMGVALLDVAHTFLKSIVLEEEVRRKSIDLISHILKVSPDFFRKNQIAKVSNRIVSEIRKIEIFLLHAKIGLPTAILGLIVFGYILFSGIGLDTPLIGSFIPENYSQKGNWFLAALIIGFSPLKAFFLLFDKKIQKVRKDIAKADDDIAEISYETINGVREFRNNFAFDYAISRVGAVFEHLRKVEVNFSKIQSLFSGIGPVLDGLVKCILLAIGARLCLGPLEIPFTGIQVESIHWNDYLGFAGMALVVDQYADRVTKFLLEWRMTRESFRRIDDYKNAEIVFSEKPEALSIEGGEDDIIFKDLGFETDDGIKRLNRLDFKIKHGEHIALVGPSGCGKSTTLNLLVYEIRQTSGDLNFSGKKLSECNFLSLAEEIGLVQQKPVLFNMSLRDNILLGLRRKSDKTIEGWELPVDISRLDNCKDLEDLNACLINVVKKVGLESDVVKKGLDHPLNTQFKGSELIYRAGKIRELVRQKVEQDPLDVIQFFHSDVYLYESTLLENLVFGSCKKDETAQDPDDTKQNPGKIFFSLIKGTKLFEQLLLLGRQQFIQDKNVALRIKHHSNALYNILSAYFTIDKSFEPLADKLGKIDLNQIKELSLLKEEHQQALLDVALSSNARFALSFFPEPSDFINNVISSRRKILSGSRIQSLDVRSFDLQNPGGGIPIRDILIGGQVNSEIHGAHQKVDKLLVQILTDENMLEEIVMIGLESPAGGEGQFLSGGQAMKVAIARILLKNPSILLLDEATAALDGKSQARIVQLIEDDYKDKTVITISHRLSTIRNYDRILVFDRGHVVQQGTYDELVAQEGLFLDLVRQEKGETFPASGMSPQVRADSSREQQAFGQAVTMSDIQRAIALSPIFSNLHSEETALLERMVRSVKCPEGKILFKRGDENDEFYIIINGEVEFFIDREKGGPLDVEIIDTFGPGQSFGELAMFGRVPRTLGARAKTDLRLCTLFREDVIKLIEINPQIAVSLLETVSRRIAQMREKNAA